MAEKKTTTLIDNRPQCPKCRSTFFETMSHDVENKIHIYRGYCGDCHHDYDQHYRILGEEPIIREIGDD